MPYLVTEDSSNSSDSDNDDTIKIFNLHAITTPIKKSRIRTPEHGKHNAARARVRRQNVPSDQALQRRTLATEQDRVLRHIATPEAAEHRRTLDTEQHRLHRHNETPEATERHRAQDRMRAREKAMAAAARQRQLLRTSPTAIAPEQLQPPIQGNFVYIFNFISNNEREPPPIRQQRRTNTHNIARRTTIDDFVEGDSEKPQPFGPMIACTYCKARYWKREENS